MPASRTLASVMYGGLDHLRQDAGIDHGGAGARRQAVELGDLVAAGGGQPGLDHEAARPSLRPRCRRRRRRELATMTLAPSALSSSIALPAGFVGQRFLGDEAVRRRAGSGRARARSASSRSGPWPAAIPRGSPCRSRRPARRRLRAAHWSPASSNGRGRRPPSDRRRSARARCGRPRPRPWRRRADRNGWSAPRYRPTTSMGRIVDQHSLGEGAADIDADAIGAAPGWDGPVLRLLLAFGEVDTGFKL